MSIIPSGNGSHNERHNRRHPAFRFEVADLRNDRYRPGGAAGPAEYTFPYPDGTFDVAIAASLYTHMFPARHYVEIARGVTLKGLGLDRLWPAAALLVAYGGAVLTLAVLRSKRGLG